MLALLAALSMITYLDRVCFGAAAPTIAKELDLSGVAELNWVFTAFSIAYAVFEIPAGWWGDRLGPRAMLIRIVAWWSLCTALTAIVGWQWGGVTFGGVGLLTALRFLFGAGEAGAYPNIARAIHNWFPKTQWETAQGVIWMSGRIAGGLTPLIWGLLVAGTALTPSLMNWRGAFAFFGLVGLVWCVVFALRFVDRPDDHPRCDPTERLAIGSTWERHTSEHGSVPWKALLTNRSLLMLCAMYSLINYGWAFNVTYLPSYLEQRFDVSQQDVVGSIYKGAPLWVGAIGCITGGLMVQALSSWLGSRSKARQVLGTTAMLVCAAMWLGARMTPNIHIFCICISLAAFCVDVTLGATWATCTELGRRHTAVAAAFMNTIGTAGSALASWATGFIVQSVVAQRTLAAEVAKLDDPTQLTATMEGYQLVFITYAIVYVLAAACWFGIDANRPIEDESKS